MKQILILAAFCGTALSFSSCGINTALIANHNVSSTQVQLTSNNFKVVDKVSGNSEVFYIFGIGGLNKKKIYENAYAAMVDKANLKGGARAIINTVAEEHIWGVPPIYFKRTVTVSGNIMHLCVAKWRG